MDGEVEGGSWGGGWGWREGGREGKEMDGKERDLQLDRDKETKRE